MTRTPRIRLHIDADPGLDDLLALVLALRCPEAELCSLTTVAGNASIDAVTANAQRLLALAGKTIPIGRGPHGPLALSSVDATWYHGEDGRRGVSIPAIDRRPLPAAERVLREALAERRVDTLLALGPLTNLAHLIERDPELLEGVEIVWMGGTLGKGNVTAVAEFNCYADPAAADKVLRSGLAVRMIGLEVTRQVSIPAAAFRRLPFANDGLAQLARDILCAQMDAEEPVSGERRATLHDPCALFATLPLDLFRYEPKSLRVVVEEGAERGRLVAGDASRGPLRYAVEVNVQEVLRAFRECIEAPSE